jgi:rubrerythrin
MQDTEVKMDGGATGRSSRRRVLTLAGGTAAAGAVASFLAACGSEEGSAEKKVSDIPTADDLSIANYALLLEHLEAGFYSAVVSSGVIADAALAKTVKEIYANEREHVDALAATVEQLGGTPVEAPDADFKEVIDGGQEEVLRVAAEIENLGAAAYLGQAARIQAPDILALALSIHTVEARHAAAINQAAGNAFETGDKLIGSIPDGDLAKPMDMGAVEDALEPYLPDVAAEAKEQKQ